jgi:hypothetical protein
LGGTGVTEKVILDDGKHLMITKDLESVLFRLAHKKPESGSQDKTSAAELRLVWADAICINQKDIEGKNAQVQQDERYLSKSTRRPGFAGGR